MPTASPTLGPYEPYTIAHLRGRTYGSGSIEITEVMEETDAFTRYMIRYPSDGLSLYGFASVPKGEGPFPVIIVIHGLVDPATYQTLDYTTPVADTLTRAGYIVIHPNLRGYPPSSTGGNLFRVGMAIDVLNLTALIKSEAGPTELLDKAQVDRIGLWGHSMGGNVVLRVLTVSSDVKAAVLYASLSGDELKNAELLADPVSNPIFQAELSAPRYLFEQISPLHYYSDITSAIQVHHGQSDPVVPVRWAQQTCEALTKAGVENECIYYEYERHTFRSRVVNRFNRAMLRFYEKFLYAQ